MADLSKFWHDRASTLFKSNRGLPLQVRRQTLDRVESQSVDVDWLADFSAILLCITIQTEVVLADYSTPTLLLLLSETMRSRYYLKDGR